MSDKDQAPGSRSLHVTAGRHAVVFALVSALLLAGYGIGRLAGGRFARDLVLGGARFPLLFARPVQQFYEIYAMINSVSPYERLSGYYSLMDAGMMDDRFLMERYRLERLTVTRRVLLWLLSFSDEPGTAVEFYASVYPSSDESLKPDILRWMNRMDPRFCAAFAKKNKVDLRGVCGE